MHYVLQWKIHSISIQHRKFTVECRYNMVQDEVYLRKDRVSIARIWEKTDRDGLVQNCSNSIANALKLLQSCTKPSIVL